MAGAAGGAPAECSAEDTALAKWTFLRYCVLGSIFVSEVLNLRAGACRAEKAEAEKTSGKAEAGQSESLQSAKPSDPMIPSDAYQEHPFKQHPKLTTNIKTSCFFHSVVVAGWLFVLTEGVGLTIYFSMSAVLDNIAIFFIKEGSGACATTKAVSLYTMAVVTFLPNVVLGSWLQKHLYNEGTLLMKALFAVIMLCITAASFVARMELVYTEGYVSVVHGLLSHVSSHWRVALAACVPPMVDGIQSTALIMVGRYAPPLIAVIMDVNKEIREMKALMQQQQLHDAAALTQMRMMQRQLDDMQHKINNMHNHMRHTAGVPQQSSFSSSQN